MTTPRRRCCWSIHGDRDRTAIEVLNQYVAIRRWSPMLTDQLDRSWSDVRAGSEITGPFLAGLTTVLGSAREPPGAAARQRVWSALIADATPYNLGAKAHTRGGRTAVVDRRARPEFR